MDSESTKLGKNLKRIRIEKKMSQGGIIRALRCSLSYVSNIESGKTNATLTAIVKLAKAVGVSTSELLK